jgi:hypothetical protein
MRLLCKGKNTPDTVLADALNAETKDGRDMKKYATLLDGAVRSIIDVKGKSEIDAFLSGGAVSLAEDRGGGLDDFELIGFLVVR